MWILLVQPFLEEFSDQQMYCNLNFSRRRPVPQLLLPWSMSISSVPTVPSELGLRGTGIILPRLIDWFWEYRVFHKCIFLFNWLIVVVTFLLFYRNFLLNILLRKKSSEKLIENRKFNLCREMKRHFFALKHKTNQLVYCAYCDKQFSCLSSGVHVHR